MNNKSEETIILQCPRCGRIRHWLRNIEKEGPGFCYCKSYQYWKVLKEEPKRKKGYVMLISDDGYQYLKAPYYREDPKAWKKFETKQ